MKTPIDAGTSNFKVEFQELLRPVLPNVRGCIDFAQEKQLLERINGALRMSGVKWSGSFWN